MGSASAIMTWIFCEMEVGAEEMDRAAAFWAKVGQGKHAIRIWQKENRECQVRFRVFHRKLTIIPSPRLRESRAYGKFGIHATYGTTFCSSPYTHFGSVQKLISIVGEEEDEGKGELMAHGGAGKTEC